MLIQTYLNLVDKSSLTKLFISNSFPHLILQTVFTMQVKIGFGNHFHVLTIFDASNEFCHVSFDSDRSHVILD